MSFHALRNYIRKGEAVDYGSQPVYGDRLNIITVPTTTYTVPASMSGVYLRFTAQAGCTVTFPANWAAGSYVQLLQANGSQQNPQPVVCVVTAPGSPALPANLLARTSGTTAEIVAKCTSNSTGTSAIVVFGGDLASA